MNFCLFIEYHVFVRKASYMIYKLIHSCYIFGVKRNVCRFFISLPWAVHGVHGEWHCHGLVLGLAFIGFLASVPWVVAIAAVIVVKMWQSWHCHVMVVAVKDIRNTPSNPRYQEDFASRY